MGRNASPVNYYQYHEHLGLVSIMTFTQTTYIWVQSDLESPLVASWASHRHHHRRQSFGAAASNKKSNLSLLDLAIGLGLGMCTLGMRLTCCCFQHKPPKAPQIVNLFRWNAVKYCPQLLSRIVLLQHI